MPHGHPKTVRENYTRKDTHRSWVERKAVLQLNSDDEVAHFYYEPPALCFQCVNIYS